MCVTELNNMSMAIKWILAIIVITAIGWLIWWSGWLGAAPVPPPAPEPISAAPNTPEMTNGMSSPTDTSDEAIAQDTAAVELQMQGLSNDSAQMANGMNDKPVAQDY